ncbi:MAG: hypothetical protein HZC45_00235 [Deltaproteobacteria bacterium]|nr:hypothetical protein [Deltaproteobacteria bacterium]
MTKKQEKGKASNKNLIIGIILLALIGFGGGYFFSVYLTDKDGDITDIALLRGGETSPTLSPVKFTGRTAKAYQIAKEIPEVLDSLYCYCRCKENFGHKSLLSCYVDDHAAYCDVCMDEAIIAYDLYKQGKDVISIRKYIDKKYSSFSH